MPKLTLLSQPEVAEFVEKRVSVFAAKAAKSEQRRYKALVRAARDAIKTSGIDGKTVKALTAYVVEAMAEHAPTLDAQAAE